MSQLYVIESVSNLDGTTHERESRRKGQRVEILNCTVGQALLLVYRDDYNKLMRSTPVTNVSYGAVDIVVWTQNSEYTFGKVAA
ncbi:hypothetical protein NSS79_10510 [Paenibacillus sp. FSL L8-0436]|uniref:hypothetical protein n=1 Tax=Paenibacillus sp. FSL L8-0436 TaxID=2954686 RepID=UPI00315889FA